MMLKLILLSFSASLIIAIYIRACKMQFKTAPAHLICNLLLLIGALSMIGEVLDKLHGHWLITGHIAFVVGAAGFLVFERRGLR